MASYYELPKDQWPYVAENSFLNNATKIIKNDDNMKPLHIAIPALHTEFHVIRGSDTLLIIIGESWTYGEALAGIGSGAGIFNFGSQLEGCMGPRMAEVMGWDLYQFAIPGNCNLYMHIELDRILKHVSTLGYKQVKVVMQMTENSRELCIRWTDEFKNHKIDEWFHYGIRNDIDVIEWLKMYDEMFFEHFHNSLNSFTACPIEGIMWRNFLTPLSDKRDYNFKLIDPTMIQYTGKLVNYESKSPMIMNPIQFQDYFDNFGKKVKVSREFMEEQIKLIDDMFDYIHGNKTVAHLVYHNNHPTKYGHLVWAHHLVRQAGWKDI